MAGGPRQEGPVPAPQPTSLRPTAGWPTTLVLLHAGDDVTSQHVQGARYTLKIAEIVGARRAYSKGGSPSCHREGVAGETLRRGGMHVIRIG